MEFKLIEPEEVKHLGREGSLPSLPFTIVAFTFQLSNKRLLDCGKRECSFAINFLAAVAFCQKPLLIEKEE